MSDEVIVALDEVRKTYHLGAIDVHALQGVTMSMTRAEYVAIMGPSGSGKSTLLNLLGCLDRPTSGSYFLGGEDVAQMNDDQLSAVRNQRIGFVFQSFNLLPHLTVLENIQLPLLYQDNPIANGEERSEELAGRVGLQDRLHHRPNELSGGQQQRVAMARALVTDPVIILADEPTGNLDSKTELEILDLVDSLNEEGKTIIMVTHDDHVAERAHRVVRLLDGVVNRIDYNT